VSDRQKARINRFRSDPSGWAGAGVMTAFAAYAGWRFSQTTLLFFALLLVRDLAASWFLLVRLPSRSVERRWRLSGLAYLSSFLPLAYSGGVGTVSTIAAANLLAIVGFALSTVALLELGPSFGVAAASRREVRTGVYRYLRHPMYVGYALAELGMVVLNPANAGLYAVSMLLYRRRALVETSELNLNSKLKTVPDQHLNNSFTPANVENVFATTHYLK
jgi:protein-S-isoprenylcysteine O-methyltransferase Ste14